MATVIVGEMREGTASIKKGRGTSLTFSSQFHFRVLADSSSVSREEVLLGTVGLPIVGVVYGLIQATCTGISAKREQNNVLYWQVTCEFDTGREDQKNNPSDPDNPDPTTWLPVFVIDSFETRQRVLTKDKSNPAKPCVNSAGQPFSDPLVETVTLCSYTFTQFEDPSQDINTIMDRNETVNSLAFRGRDARTLKLNVTGAELGYYAGFPAWRNTYRVTYDRETWDVKLNDVGPNQRKLVTVGAVVELQLLPCKDANGVRIVGNLDGTGRQQEPDEEPTVLEFKTHSLLDFNTFIRV